MPENDKEKDSIESVEGINASMISHAKEVAKEINANAVLIYVDVFNDLPAEAGRLLWA